MGSSSYPIEESGSIHGKRLHDLRNRVMNKGKTTKSVCQLSPEKALRRPLSSRAKELLAWKRKTFTYPQNMMRNLARAGCAQEYVIVPGSSVFFFKIFCTKLIVIVCFLPPDIDMAPSPGLDQALETFLRHTPGARDCDSCAYIVPIFEIMRGRKTLPVDKRELKHMLRKGSVRLYQQATSEDSQKATNVSR